MVRHSNVRPHSDSVTGLGGATLYVAPLISTVTESSTNIFDDASKVVHLLQAKLSFGETEANCRRKTATQVEGEASVLQLAAAPRKREKREAHVAGTYVALRRSIAASDKQTASLVIFRGGETRSIPHQCKKTCDCLVPIFVLRGLLYVCLNSVQYDDIGIHWELLELGEVAEERLEVCHEPWSYKVNHVLAEQWHVMNMEGRLDGVAANNGHIFAGPCRSDSQL